MKIKCSRLILIHPNPNDGRDLNQINYIFYRPVAVVQPFFSLAPEESDSVVNQTVLTGLVGSLVKYGLTGRIEPSLASNWSKSEDEREWTFFLNEDATCDDGSRIKAPEFVKVLKNQLAHYAKRGRVMVFEDLVGWPAFLKNQSVDLQGIRSRGDSEIHFSFNRKPNELLEVLRMPYFGYWCANNFIAGKFRTDGGFTSSGKYRLKFNDRGIKIRIESRVVSTDSSIANQIDFYPDNFRNEVGSYRRTIVRIGISEPVLSDIESFYVVHSPPIVTTALVLSPWSKSKLFRKPFNRKVVLARLRNSGLAEVPAKDSVLSSRFFYANSLSPVKFTPPQKDELNYRGEEVLVSLPTALGLTAQTWLQSLIKKLLKEVPVEKIRFVQSDTSEPLERKRLASNRYYDVRVMSVMTSGAILNAAVDMMFCTNLGVSLPDLDKHVCSLVADYNRSGRDIDARYIERFNQVLADDALVLPVFNSGLTWLYSRDFDPKTIPTGTVYPQFEALRFVK